MSKCIRFGIEWLGFATCSLKNILSIPSPKTSLTPFLLLLSVPKSRMRLLNSLSSQVFALFFFFFFLSYVNPFSILQMARTLFSEDTLGSDISLLETLQWLPVGFRINSNSLASSRRVCMVWPLLTLFPPFFFHVMPTTFPPALFFFLITPTTVGFLGKSFEQCSESLIFPVVWE